VDDSPEQGGRRHPPAARRARTGQRRWGLWHPDEGSAGMMSMPAALAHLSVAWARCNAATLINL